MTEIGFVPELPDMDGGFVAINDSSREAGVIGAFGTVVGTGGSPGRTED